jgi:outer membrane cobalamin receptor
MGPCRLSRNGQSGYKDSRIAARGFTQPTPTTSLSSADLEKAAKPNLFNTLTELPALQGSTGRTTNTYSTSSGIQGLSSLSLRGLGTLRTLTLLDGQRVVGANVTGVTDVSQFPQLLVKRVDVVTGGASASYVRTRSAAWSTSSPTRSSPASRPTSKAG